MTGDRVPVGDRGGCMPRWSARSLTLCSPGSRFQTMRRRVSSAVEVGEFAADGLGDCAQSLGVGDPFVADEIRRG